MRNTKLTGAIFSALFLSAVNVNAAPPGNNVTIQVTPVAGTAVVDGDYSEWDLSADFAANMCTAGSIGVDGNCEGNGKVNLSDLYLRYDCDKNILYVLVLEQDNYEAEQSADDAWVTINGNSNKVVNGNSGNDGTPPDFAWVEDDGDLLGYEASFTLEAGTYSAQVHLNVSGNTSSTGKNGDILEITVEKCDHCAYIYSVHDEGLNDSQILRYKSDTGIEPLGLLLEGADIEALDTSPEDVLFGASGDDTDKPGHLYTFDMTDGTILSEKDIVGCDEVDGISFNPVDGNLIGWDQEQGLVEITYTDNSAACSTIIPNPPGLEIEDLTWDNAGETLYFAYNDHGAGADPDEGNDAKVPHKIGKYSVADGVEWGICDIAAPEIEALEILNDGTLLVGYHDNGEQLVKMVNPFTCETAGEGEIEAKYNDLEGIAVCLPEEPEDILP